MFRKICVLMLFAVIVSITHARLSFCNEISNEINNTPNISFVKPKHNFGEIFRGDKVEHIYKFKNIGKGELKINKVKTFCGCTAAVIKSVNSSYGETGEIKIIYKSKSDLGKVLKHITVISNDPDTPEYKLIISGNVIEEVVVEPRKVSFDEILYGTGVTKILSIKSVVDPGFKIKQVVSNNPDIKVILKKDEIKNEYVLDASLNKDAKLGRLNSKITLHTNSKRMPKVEIPCYGRIVGDISVYPPRISCGVVEEKIEKTVPVYATAYNMEVAINSVKIEPDFLKAEFSKIDDKIGTYKINVTLKKDAPVGRFTGGLKIFTTSKNQPVLEVPVYGMVKEG